MIFDKVLTLSPDIKGTFSCKDDTEISVNGVKFYRYRLSAALRAKLPSEPAEKVGETEYFLALAKARGEEKKYPHWDALIHDLMKGEYTAVISSELISALVCSANGETTARELFGDSFGWIKACEQGIDMALAVQKFIDKEYKDTLFIEGYGMVFSADSVEAVEDKVRVVLSEIKSMTVGADTAAVEYDFDKAALVAPAIRMLTGDLNCTDNKVGSVVTFHTDAAVVESVCSESSFEQIVAPISADQAEIIRGGLLFVDSCEDIEDQYKALEEKISAYREEKGVAPSIVALEGLGVYACGKTKAEADEIMSAFNRSLAVRAYSKAFGGAVALPLNIAKVASAFAESKAEKTLESEKRISQKIMIVTGGAQGFGEGIADDLLANGANVAIADLNIDLANAKAEEFCQKYGKGASIALKTDVSDEDSVKDMVYRTVLAYGGLDCMVSNAGIARSGNLEQMTKDLLELHTRINYTGFFLCAKYASRIMKIQYRFCNKYFGDIIQVNSKSGLVGSNKNFAYAGSKFGGIGLTQSFALELVDYNVKVNSICPGNYFDGPLWSDPEKGLFKQYLLSGKVPGAENVADVRKFYESKIPMHAGCFPVDVARAIMYCIEQLYETGQAIPVTGGQVMLS